MKRWTHRCASCGNPRHFLFFYVRGALAWHLLCRWFDIPPLWLVKLVADYAYDHRGCAHACGPETLPANPIAAKREAGR